jgi:LysR family transcriptional regulator, chromosome initiation inhibitor
MSLLDPQLQAFLAIVKHKTVISAASAIHITQTAVTQRIKSLENRLKASLFIRTRKGMRLTSEGEALLRYCLAAKELEGETLSSIRGVSKEQNIELRLDAPSSVMHTRIIPNLMPIMKKYPRILLNSHITDIENRHLSLKKGECDFAILSPEQVAMEMVAKQLHPDEYVLVCCKKWHARKLKEIIKNECIVDFDPTDQMTYNYLRKYNLFKDARKNRYFVNNITCLIEFISSGLAYSVLTKEIVDMSPKSKNLYILNDHAVLTYPLVLAWYQRPIMPEYFKAIINAIE